MLVSEQLEGDFPDESSPSSLECTGRIRMNQRPGAFSSATKAFDSRAEVVKIYIGDLRGSSFSAPCRRPRSKGYGSRRRSASTSLMGSRRISSVISARMGALSCAFTGRVELNSSSLIQPAS